MAEVDKVMRYHIADYLEVTGGETPEYALCGTGVTTLDEEASPQTNKTVYINDRSASTSIKSYETVFPFTSQLIKSERAIMELFRIGRDHKTGTEADRDYVRVELFEPIADKENTFKARKFRVAVAVDSFSGDGGDPIEVSGSLNGVGDFVDGEFNTATKTFTEAGATPPPAE